MSLEFNNEPEPSSHASLLYASSSKVAIVSRAVFGFIPYARENGRKEQLLTQ